MVVLSTGLEISRETIALSKTLGIDLDKYHFTRTDSFHPVATSVPGIYACGVFTGPKDIPQSVMEASAAACAATEHLAAARNTQTKTVAIPAQRDVSREAPRIGVFVCNCGINIGGIVRVPEVAEYCSDPARGRVCGGKPVYLHPGHPGQDDGGHPGKRIKPGGRGGLYTANP